MSAKGEAEFLAKERERRRRERRKFRRLLVVSVVSAIVFWSWGSWSLDNNEPFGLVLSAAGMLVVPGYAAAWALVARHESRRKEQYSGGGPVAAYEWDEGGLSSEQQMANQDLAERIVFEQNYQARMNIWGDD